MLHLTAAAQLGVGADEGLHAAHPLAAQPQVAGRTDGILSNFNEEARRRDAAPQRNRAHPTIVDSGAVWG
jgi:hypothetical protein